MMMKLLALLISAASAEGTEAAAAGMFAGMSLMEKGLIVTFAGLLGVFLVLCLFFITIKVMQKVGKQK